MHTDVHAHVPYSRLTEYLPYIVTNRINPEIFFSAAALDQIIWEELAAHAQSLRAAGLRTTIHAPFLDLNPGAVDPLIRSVTAGRFRQVFKAAGFLTPRVIVCHPGYDDLHYCNNRIDWLKNSITFWREFTDAARETGTVIAIENIFDSDPSMLRALLEEVDDPVFRHCFDTGHWNMFATGTLEEWFGELGHFIAECHLHDNHGHADEHLPVGEGMIDFSLVFNLLDTYAPHAVKTMEAHSIERLERTLKNAGAYIAA